MSREWIVVDLRKNETDKLLILTSDGYHIADVYGKDNAAIMANSKKINEENKILRAALVEIASYQRKKTARKIAFDVLIATR